MSAAEVIEQIKTLPQEERQQVVEFVRAYEIENGAAAKLSREAMFQRAEDKVFAEHHDLLRRLAQ